MTKIVKMDELKEYDFIKHIKEGKIIVYPTDTIYGLGCDAKNTHAVQKIRELKDRTDKSFSVVAPSKQWIYDNFEVKNKNYIEKLPGPYTFILNSKKAGVVSYHANSGSAMGIRIPDHKITSVIQKARTPFINTSVSRAGEEIVNDIRRIPKRVLKEVDLVIDGGTLNNQASVLIDLTGSIPKIIRRE